MKKAAILRLMNVRATESALVFRLLAIQFVLGLATAFLISASYSLFLYEYPVTKAPDVFILAAVILFPINAIYARADLKLNSKKLLQATILFAALSMALMLGFWKLTSFKWMIIVIAAWNLSLYMVVGYAYWGLASLLFNVRESRRIFSVIGAGDLPAKAIGYIAVSLFAHSIGLDVIMATSILFFLLAFYLCKKLFSHSGIDWDRFENESHHAAPEKVESWWMRLFENKLIQWIAILSVISYIILYLFDFTFLSQVKVRFHSEHELAKFISLFFAAGRLLAIVVKLVISSRLIARLGLTRTLLITPLLMLGISACIFLLPVFKMYEDSYLYAFGVLVLISEVLRSTIQEPVFFILFQPLSIHLRLKGHLVAKGYVFPPALTIVGVGLATWLYFRNTPSIPGILIIASVLFLAWIATIFKIDREYLSAVQRSIQKGFFSGVALFLDDDKVKLTLLEKITQGNTTEKLHALHLLEKSGYDKLEPLMLSLLDSNVRELQLYALVRIEERRFVNAAGVIEKLYKDLEDPALRTAAYQVACMLDDAFFEQEMKSWETAGFDKQKSLLICLARKGDNQIASLHIRSALQKMAGSNDPAVQLQLLEILDEAQLPASESLLSTLASRPMEPGVYRQWIAVAGKLASPHLLNSLLEALADRPYRVAAVNALLHVKETLFENPALDEIKNTELLEQLAGIAAKTKNSAATVFLLKMLAQKQLPVAVIAGSLWQQQYSTGGETNSVLTAATSELIEGLNMKYYLMHQVDDRQHQLLAQALNSEVETGMMALLQLLAIQYGRKELARVIELLEMKQFSKMHNAIELLELSVPRKLFTQVIELVDHLTGDPGRDVKVSARLPFADTASSILSKSEQFNDWTKAVIWWLAGSEKDVKLLPMLAAFTEPNDSPILKETKEFVIFSHNHNSN